MRTGAVRTSVTLLVQNMGNTLLLIVYTPFVLFAVLIGQIAATFCSLSKWLSARIKLLAATSTWPQEESPKPNFQAIACDGFESNAPTGQGTAKKEALAFEFDRSAGAHPPRAHLRIVQIF